MSPDHAATSSDDLDRPSFRGRRVLVTGAGGFIGGHLVDRLRQEGADVVALTHAEADLTDRRATQAAVARAEPEVVFHLAAARDKSTSDARNATALVNTMSGAWVVEAVPNHCHAVIRLGSSTEYAVTAEPMDEDTPLRPRGFFGATKAAGSMLFAAAAAERGVRSCVLRAFQVYGPRDKPARFVPTVLRAAATGRPLPLTQAGMRRDWVWVGDVVDACLGAASRAELPDSAVYNIGTGTQTTNEELVATAQRVTGRRIPTRPGTHPGRSWDTGDWGCDASAAASDLGWTPLVDLTEGLARCWESVGAGTGVRAAS